MGDLKTPKGHFKINWPLNMQDMHVLLSNYKEHESKVKGQKRDHCYILDSGVLMF